MNFRHQITSIFHRLETRIVLAFMLLLVALLTTAFFYISRAIDANARTAVHAQLQVGERVFRNLLAQNAQKLSSGATILAADYAFREAVVTRDQETISSVLDNHGRRIGSTITFLIDLERHIQAQASNASESNLQPIATQLAIQLEKQGSTTEIAIFDGIPIQFVIVPIKAPITMGWVVMGFPLNQNVVDNMKTLSGLDSSIFTLVSKQNKEKNDVQGWQLNVTTLASKDVGESAISPVGINFGGKNSFKEIQIAGNEISALSLDLASNSNEKSVAMLYLSVSAEVAQYMPLKLNLLILMIVGLAVTIFLSILFARHIVGPLRQLTAVASRLGMGEYEVEIKTGRKDQIGELAVAFSHMRKDIALREEAISRLAYWDPLTSLPNRAQFLAILQKAIAQSAQEGKECHVLMMDLDRFKVVNDVMGHRFGDILLTQVAQRLTTELGQLTHQPARLGGDEFALVLPCATSQQALALADLVLVALEKPILIEDQTVDLSAGIGIATYPRDGDDASSLLIRAEIAMYAAKAAHSGAIIYRPEIDQSSQHSLSLLSELREALETNAFRLFAQPKIDLRSNRVVAVEALVRWVHPERGMIFPDHFIPFSEQTGFIRLLTLWVLEESAVACRTWLDQGLQMKVSVNLSTRDLLDQELPLKIQTILKRHELMPKHFCLEITESAIMDDPIRAQQTLDTLSQMGFELSIDDFGTGYSSLAYLKRLPVDELKIDKSFVLNMEKDANDTKIVRSTIDLGHNMGLRVVAEGVENEVIMQLLAEFGCDQAQGYFMSRPIPVNQICAWVQKWDQEHNHVVTQGDQ